ncbi:MAG TPA: glycosyltransferase [Candidatus Angelobacter sp.]|nr:glycosyltransferase [Candidatus Angelobacter sp.]
MKILITNAYLDVYAGTQVVVRDLALELLRQGHEPVIYSPFVDAVADEIRSSGIMVVDSLSRLTGSFDIIHGHHLQALEALLYFPSVPGIYVCHGAFESVFYFPRILRYVAVDEPCRKRLVSGAGIPAEQIEVIPNAVDLARFQPRAPLPSRPKRALVFSNNANNTSHVPAVRRACMRAGLELDVVGFRASKSVRNPESILSRYDIVFAKARCALEALAVGNAVVLCDSMGLGPMVSTRNLHELQPRNFGHTTLINPLRSELIQAEIERYDPAEAALVSARVRDQSGLVEATQRWLNLYSETIEEFRLYQQDLIAEYRAVADCLSQWNYEKRVLWERQQLENLRSVPLIGGTLHYFARRILRRWTHGWGLP